MNTRTVGCIKPVMTAAALFANFSPGLAPRCRADVQSFPERFGIINVTPNFISTETAQNSEPSFAIGWNSQFEQIVLHTFGGVSTVPGNLYYTSLSFDSVWAPTATISDRDATVDWSPGGTCYIACIPALTQISVLQSTDPLGGVGFTTVPGSTITRGSWPNIPDQPWIRVANVTNVDHILVGYNDLSRKPGKTATVRFSMDGGTTWKETIIEKSTPGAGQDSPAIRLAISGDGRTVYALFQRWNTTTSAGDQIGDVVLMRDDKYGAGGFGGLGSGHVIEHNVLLPGLGGTSLGAQRLGCGCAIAINPTDPSQVFVAYTEVANGAPVIYALFSSDWGNSWTYLPLQPPGGLSLPNASLPALAVANDGTVGLLYLEKPYVYQHVVFMKALGGSFTPENMTQTYLADWTDNDPVNLGQPYVGDYFDLRAVNFNFYGCFSASANPLEFWRSGLYYQRDVYFGTPPSGTVRNDFELNVPGAFLCNLAGTKVPYSIDPFFFYDIAPYSKWVTQLSVATPTSYRVGDPLNGTYHLSWPALTTNEPQYQLMCSPALGTNASWRPATNNLIIKTNGQFVASLIGSQAQAFYRLQQNVAGNQFTLFAGTGLGGSLTPSGILTNASLSSRTFTATPTNSYAVSKWFLDGVLVKSNTPSFTLSNIVAEHVLTVSFVPTNDLAVSVYEMPLDEGPTETYSTNRYTIDLENRGLNTLTGIALTNYLPSTVSFLSATNTQGTANYFGGGLVTAQIGSLSPATSARVTIYFVPFLAGSITNSVAAVCNQFEPNLSNNSATAITTVIDPVVITNQPASQSATAGSTVSFNVGVAGTPPFTYEWFFNATNLLTVTTNSTLTLTNVGAAQAGTYTVTAFQILSPEDIEGNNSTNAVLTVH
ncbi:MAG: hypothetical protein C5B50_06125 [Verrucomicrobia bacterium]|nr:MAG: hypothetical protein C5B50_06125 [Verrucomicrobiota bacterium]